MFIGISLEKKHTERGFGSESLVTYARPRAFRQRATIRVWL